MIGRIGEFSARHARTVAAIWILAAVSLILWAPSLAKVGVQDETAFLPASSPSIRAQYVLQHLFPGDPSSSSAVVVLSSKNTFSARDWSYIGRLDLVLHSPPMNRWVGVVESPVANPALSSILVSQDDKAALVVVGLRPAPFTTSSEAAVAQMRPFLYRSAPAGLSPYVTGIAGLGADEAAGVTSSFSRAGLVAAVLITIILLFVYRSVLALAVPLGTIAAGFAVAQGMIGLLAAHGFKVASLAATFMIVVIFGAGTDYCLFIISRYREELHNESDATIAAGNAMRSVGPVVVASGATVVLGFASLAFARFGIYRTMGPAIGIAVAVTLLASLTLTPAMLALLGSRVQPRARTRQRRQAPAAAPTAWRRVGVLVTRRPVLMAAVPAVALAAGCGGLLALHQSFNIVRELPGDADSRIGYDVLARHFPSGALAPIEIGIDARGKILGATDLAQVDQLTDQLRRIPGVAKVFSVTEPLGVPITTALLARSGALTDLATALPSGELSRLTAAAAAPGGLRFTGTWLQDTPALRKDLGYFLGVDGRSTRLEVMLSGNPYSAADLQVVQHVRTTIRQVLKAGPLAGAAVAIGGPSVAFGDIQHLASQGLILIIIVVLVLVLVVLAVLLRAIVAPLYLIATVVLSYGAALGITALVFDRLLGQGSLSFWVPPFLFVILVALGADYTIFVMGRIAEARQKGLDVRSAAAEGLVASGPVVSAAGLILAGTFAVLLVTPLPTLRQVGFAVSLGVLIDTFVVRPLLLPALTAMAGQWAFWPGERHTEATEHPRRRPRYALALSVGGVATALAIAGVELGTLRTRDLPQHQASAPSARATIPSPPSTMDTPSASPAKVGAKPVKEVAARTAPVATEPVSAPPLPNPQTAPTTSAPTTTPTSTPCPARILDGPAPLVALLCTLERALFPEGG
jgi:RND superfamily putative drug exporter